MQVVHATAAMEPGANSSLMGVASQVGMHDPNFWIATGTGLAAISAVAAIVVSVIVYKGQGNLSTKLSREQSDLSARISIEQSATSERISKQQAELSMKIHDNQMVLSQRQLLIPLWAHMSILNHIDPENPIEPDAIRLVNTLELIAVCCEGKMVDAQVIKRVFRDLYMQFYEEIAGIRMLPGRKISGAELLKENRAAMHFYDELKREHMDRDKLRDFRQP